MKNALSISKNHPILLFDGVCNLCNGAVQFVIERDAPAKFRFTALQSELGQELLAHFDLPTDDMFSVILIDNEEAYTRSTAVLKMLRKFGNGWRFLYYFIVVPLPIRDFIYDFIARNRYRWFGQKESCMIPTPDLQSRFL